MPFFSRRTGFGHIFDAVVHLLIGGDRRTGYEIFDQETGSRNATSRNSRDGDHRKNDQWQNNHGQNDQWQNDEWDDDWDNDGWDGPWESEIRSQRRRETGRETGHKTGPWGATPQARTPQSPTPAARTPLAHTPLAHTPLARGASTTRTNVKKSRADTAWEARKNARSGAIISSADERFWSGGKALVLLVILGAIALILYWQFNG